MIRSVIQKVLKNDFVSSGFEDIALDDGIFPRLIFKQLAFIYII